MSHGNNARQAGILSAFDLERNWDVEKEVEYEPDLPGCLQDANLWARVMEL